jgi:hypothetical protein
MEHHDTEAVVSQQLKRLWSLLSDLDQAHVARLARAAGRHPVGRGPYGRRAA